MTKIYAHRGYSKNYPENTMLAFKKALEYGADAIELDVHPTLDGEVVICHDETIDRTSNGKGHIKDQTLEELREYVFSNGMNIEPQDLDDVRIPTLREFFEWFKDQSGVVNIELKTDYIKYDGLAESVYDLIKEFNMAERVIISSFNHESVVDMKSFAPELKYAFLNMTTLADPGHYCNQHGVDYYHPSLIALSKRAHSDCLEYGVEANVFTVDKPKMIQHFAEMNVAGIITNDVETAVGIIK